jgi:hypothetical protein
MSLYVNQKAIELSNAASVQAQPATIIGLLTRAEFKPELVDGIVKTIIGIVKQAEGITSKLFRLIQSCDTVHQAKGTFTEAESKACKELGAKSISQIATKGGIKALSSYMAIKSTLFTAIERAEDLSIIQQELWNFETKFEAKEQKYVPEGYLDPWGIRYKDKDKGSTLFMSDYRTSSEAGKLLASKQALQKKAQELALAEAAKRNETAGVSSSATNGANAGMAGSSGASTDMVIDNLTVDAINDLKRAVHDVYANVNAEDVRKLLYICTAELRKLASNEHEMLRGRASEAGNSPVAATAETEELPEVVPATTESHLDKPDWITDEDWSSAQDDEERGIMMEDKEMYLEDLQARALESAGQAG